MVAAPAPLADSGRNEFLAALAKGLGVSADRFAGLDPVELGERLGRIASELASGAKDMLDERARAGRTLGSRKLLMPRGLHGNALKYASSAPDAVLSMLLSGGSEAQASIQQGFAELKGHQRNILSAALTAAQTLGENLDPATLKGATPSSGSPEGQKARLWEMYGSIWQGFGSSWPEGFVEAFKLHMADAYDSNSN